MRTAGTMLVAGILLAGTAACGSDSASSASSDEKKVGFLIHNMTGNAWLAAAADEMTTSGKENGINVTVIDGRGDISQMISTINDFTSQGMDAIVVVPPDEQSLAEPVKRAMERDIPVMAFSLDLSDEVGLTSFIGANEIEIGRGLGELAAEAMGGKGALAEQTGVLGSTAQLGRSDGLREALKDFPEIEIVESQPDNWLQDKTVSLTQDWLVKYGPGELKALVSHGPQVTAASVIAKSKGRDDIKVIATDYPEEVRKAIQSGELYGAIAQFPRAMSDAAIKEIKTHFDGGKMAPEVLVPIEKITKENVNEISAAY